MTTLAITAPPSSAEAAELVTAFDVKYSAFSPDGDGAQDLTYFPLTLSEDSPALSLVVYEGDSTTVVDTLVAGVPRAAGVDTVFWDGTDRLGQTVAEGLYLVRLAARGTTAADTVITLPVAVDVTPPKLQILLSEPGIYAPGLEGTPQIYSLTFTVTNSSPTYGLPTLEDQLLIQLFGPNEAKVTLDTFVTVRPAYRGQDGTYELEWNANYMNQVADGHYRFKFQLNDMAGHHASASDRPNVDVEPPDIGYLNMESGQTLAVVPDSLRAWAWDRNGIDSLFVRYAASRPYLPVADRRVERDTTFFSVPLADSAGTEGQHRVSFRIMDGAAADTGWVSTPSLSFEVDMTAPAPPTLNPFNGTWRNPDFDIVGRWSDGTEIVRVYQNGALVDSVFTVALESQGIDSLTVAVTLTEGRNVFTAIAVDEALNESGPSNEVWVQFASDAGLFMPAPFTPNDEFHLNLPTTASRATLRLYDLSGDVVVVLSNPYPARSYAFSWDGMNGDGESTKKGPLVAVSQAEYDDGGAADVVYREIFLFDPDK